MLILKGRVVLPLVSSVLALCAATATTPDDALALKRALKPEAPLAFRSVHAESFAIDGDPASALRYDGDAKFSVVATPNEAAGTFALAPAYTDVTASWREGAGKEPFAAQALTGSRVEWKDGKTTLTKERVLDAPTNWPNALAAEWYAEKEPLVRRLATALSSGDGPWSTQTRLNLALPPLPSAALKKGDRYDADYVVGYLGGEAQIQVFYTSVLEAFDDKTATFAHSGAPKIVRFEKAASRRADGLDVDVDAEASSFSARVVISRADGAVLSREGELALTLKATTKKEGASPAVVRAKIWTKIERL
jgi:hypothetical protein